MTRNQLMHVLSHIQNTKLNSKRDIVSWAGFCKSDDELAEHVYQHWKQLGKRDRLKVLEYARSLVNPDSFMSEIAETGEKVKVTVLPDGTFGVLGS